MYYEEQVINGVLCWRGTPNGEWTKKTPQQLTEMLLEARRNRQTEEQVMEQSRDIEVRYLTYSRFPISAFFRTKEEAERAKECLLGLKHITSAEIIERTNR